jgi:hypothetical protein
MLHKNTQERYAKLCADFRRLMHHFDRDGLDDFIQTANSLVTWIKLDDTLSQHQKDELARFTIPNGIDWQVCNQIANRQKHPKPDRNLRAALEVKSVQINQASETGFRFPSFPRAFAAGDKIMIDYECGGKIVSEPALAFVVRTFRQFYYIFELAPLPIGQRMNASKSVVELMTR